MQTTALPERLAAARGALSHVVVDKEESLRLTLACLLARGHLLIEDLPGMGKTVLAHALARVAGLDFRRVQFTSDLLPGDLIGASVFEREHGTFRFHPGPAFTELLLADEINRASPRTQSALLEAMEERQISVDGQTHRLPDAFFVVATQNPVDQTSTHALPEAQLDRFLMRIALGYPNTAAERAILAGEDRRRLIGRIDPVLDPETLTRLQEAAAAVHVADALLDYLLAVVRHTRECGLPCGLSTRAAQGLLAAARAWALIDGRDHVRPGDVQAVFPAVAAHRLALAGEASGAMRAARRLLGEVAIP